MNNDVYETSKMLKKMADKFGVVSAVSLFGSDIDISIPVSSELAEVSIESLSLSVRSYNCLMRSNVRTVKNIVDAIMSERGLKAIRNLGKKSQSEIQTVILAESYERLSDFAKLDFWKYVITHNCRDFV